jgi:hypothetical protein
VTAPERVHAPRDIHAPPPRLGRGAAEAAAQRVLADYLRQQHGGRGPVDGPGRTTRALTMLGLGALGAVLGALVGGLRGQPLVFGFGLAMVGVLLGWASTRR